jgi:hypothetical protein
MRLRWAHLARTFGNYMLEIRTGQAFNTQPKSSEKRFLLTDSPFLLKK